MSPHRHAVKLDAAGERAMPADRRSGPSQGQADDRRQPSATEQESNSAVAVLSAARQAQDLKAKWRRYRYSILRSL